MNVAKIPIGPEPRCSGAKVRRTGDDRLEKAWYASPEESGSYLLNIGNLWGCHFGSMIWNIERYQQTQEGEKFFSGKGSPETASLGITT